jgi:hypothetical protein
MFLNISYAPECFHSVQNYGCERFLTVLQSVYEATDIDSILARNRLNVRPG